MLAQQSWEICIIVTQSLKSVNSGTGIRPVLANSDSWDQLVSLGFLWLICGQIVTRLAELPRSKCLVDANGRFWCSGQPGGLKSCDLAVHHVGPATARFESIGTLIRATCAPTESATG